MKLRERLIGLGLMAAGVGGLGLLYVGWVSGLTAPMPPLPTGARPELVPVLSPLACVVPITAVACILLIFEGARRVLVPE